MNMTSSLFFFFLPPRCYYAKPELENNRPFFLASTSQCQAQVGCEAVNWYFKCTFGDTLKNEFFILNNTVKQRATSHNYSFHTKRLHKIRIRPSPTRLRVEL